MKPYSFDVIITKVSCGFDHTGFVTCKSTLVILNFIADGLLFVMGSNQYGKLGIGNSYEQVSSVKSPILINSLANKQIVDVNFNENHSLALDNNGKVYSWGYATDSALGYITDKEYQQSPK